MVSLEAESGRESIGEEGVGEASRREGWLVEREGGEGEEEGEGILDVGGRVALRVEGVEGVEGG